ncbi:MAG: SPOR domain-containing protein [Sterolibacterium sp.]|nr:SPOR domain-containing protein [Sterolibacterium sp.]
MADKSPAPATDTPRNPASADPQLHLKKRARRRLVGATALALLAVIILPMVMDQEARPPVQDIQIRIPSQDPGAHTVTSRITTKPASTTAAPATNLAAAPAPSTLAPAQAAPDTPPAPPITKDEPKTQMLPAAEHPPVAKPASKPEAKPETPHHAPAIEKSAEKPTEKPVDKAAEKPRADESVRAAALLNDEHWIIQLGAYQEHGNVKVLQSKLKELGYPSYIEKIDTANGTRIRVRCGPFPSRAAAEKAQVRLKKIGAGGPTGGSISQTKS